MDSTKDGWTVMESANGRCLKQRNNEYYQMRTLEETLPFLKLNQLWKSLSDLVNVEHHRTSKLSTYITRCEI